MLRPRPRHGFDTSQVRWWIGWLPAAAARWLVPGSTCRASPHQPLSRPLPTDRADCGSRFVRAGGAVDPALMPDGVHPAGAGGKVLVECVLQALSA